MATTRHSASIHQLKVTLQMIQPPIWRRIQVPSETSLIQLHDILQIVMGWEDYHLHVFQVGQTGYSSMAGDRDEGATLQLVMPGKRSKFTYEYDMGDGWEHLIVVEDVTPPEPGVRYPVCVAGERACPPEDCGGAWGYDELLAVLADPGHPDHEDRMDWIGESFDPEAFELEDVNRQLAQLR